MQGGISIFLAAMASIAVVEPAVLALVTVAGIPLTSSIAHGIAFGFVLRPLMKLATDRTGEVQSVGWVLSLLAPDRLLLN